MSDSLESVIPLLKEYKQEHLIQFYDELENAEKTILIDQIKKTDFAFLRELFVNSFTDEVIDSSRITPMQCFNKDEMSREEKDKYISFGEEVIINGEVAVLTLAGGMGSRLGYKGPKGCYEIDVVPKKSLFEFICDKLKIQFQRYGVYLNWYIMTSPSNDKQTKEYFESHHYFGYPKEKVYFFIQNTMNIIDTNGNVMLDSEYTLKKDSNGNGDIFQAFMDAGLVNTLENIKWISVSGIDNILLEVIDPLLIGLAISQKSSIASKSVRKQDVDGKEWVFANVDNHPNIIDPDFLTEDMIATNQYNQINILSHLFTKEAFIESSKIQIPYHRAFKKNDFINDEGMKVVAKEPNSFKFEKFIFDVFPHFENFTLLEVEKEMEFAPIKAFTGDATPENALEMYLKKIGRNSSILY